MKTPIYAALDLHSRHSVLGSMDHEGNNGPRMRFATTTEMLRSHVGALRQKKRPLYLTMEAGAFTRWASGVVRALVDRLIICEPRYNRLINSNPQKSDEADVEGMCLLLRVGKLKEVWMGVDRTREIYRALVYELLNWRDAQRELKALIKARYRGWGVCGSTVSECFRPKGAKNIWPNCRPKQSEECCGGFTDNLITPLSNGRRRCRKLSGWEKTSGRWANFSASRVWVRSRPTFLARLLTHCTEGCWCRITFYIGIVRIVIDKPV